MGKALIRGLFRKYQYQKQRLLVRNSGYFDPQWYLDQYADVRLSGADPLRHFVKTGWREGRSPGPKFITTAYLERHPDLPNGVNPLVHFLQQPQVTHSPTSYEDQSHDLDYPSDRSILWVLNSTDLQTQRYRAHNIMPALRSLGWNSRIVRQESLAPDDIAAADYIVLCRVSLASTLAQMIQTNRKKDSCVIADIDDMVFDTARMDQLWPYRHRSEKERASMRSGFEGYRRCIELADVVTASTWPLRQELETLGKRAFVVPNSLPHSLTPVIRSIDDFKDDNLSICYLSGTATHEDDFAQCSSAIRRLLEKHPTLQIHIVGHLEATSLPSERVHRHPLKTYDAMLEFLSSCDIAIAPLEINDFTSCKSELKIFEAALVGVPVVASPSLSYSSCIQNAKTGFLAATEDDWFDRLDALIGSKHLRHDIVSRAQREMIPRFQASHSARLLDRVLRNPRPMAVQSHPSLPKVSVIAVLYQKEREVRYFLEGLRQQRYRGEIEVILVNDRSPGNDVDVVRDWTHWNQFSTSQAAHLNIRIIENESNRGNCASRNVGWEASSGDIVFFTDADCVFDHQLIDAHVEALTNGFDIAIGHRGIETENDPPATLLEIVEADPKEGAKKSRIQDPFSPSSFVNCVTRNLSIRREFLNSFPDKPFDELFGYSSDPASGFGWEDVEFGCRAFEAGAKIRFLAETFAVHVSHPVSEHAADKAVRSMRNFRRLHTKHPELVQIERHWSKQTYHAISAWVGPAVPPIAVDDSEWLANHTADAVASPAIKKTLPLRVLTYRWHCPHQFELYKLGHGFDLATHAGTMMCNDWDWRHRPMPDNSRFVHSSSINPKDYDLAILHFDENVLKPERCNGFVPTDWGNNFRWLLDQRDIPAIAVCHGTPQFVGQYDGTYAGNDLESVFEDSRQQLVDALSDAVVVCNSHQAKREWRFKNSTVIWHGLSPSDFPPGENNQGILTMAERAMKARPHYNGYFIYQKVREALAEEAAFAEISVPNPGNKVSAGNSWATQKYHNYVRALANYTTYFNPTRRSPMPRTRAEAMMAGLVSVSYTSHDVDMFIKNGINGFHSRDPEELAEFMRFIGRSTSADELRRQSVRTARDEFNIDRYLSSWQQLIHSVTR